MHYLYREARGSLERVVNDLNDKKPFLHNAIYRSVFDCINGDLTECKGCIATDYLLDLGDHSLMNQLQSSFLSRNRLPNLIVSKRFNIAKNDYRLTIDEIDRLLDQFPIEDFVCMDESDAVNSLSFRLPFELTCEPACDELHPLTVIISDSTKQTTSVFQSEICLTSDLVGNRGRQKLLVFSRKNI